MSDSGFAESAGKILLVEDEPSIIELVAMFLEREGYKVVNVAEGTSVIEAVRKVHPDIVILDIMIPKLNGYEVCKNLKADPKLKDIPILILSALVQKGEI